jgi:hypothetical protein
MYFIVVFYVAGGEVKRDRCWGYFKEHRHAVRAVMEDEGHIYEHGYYNLALIEKVSEGVLPKSEGQEWFKVSYRAGKHTVEPIEKPEWAEVFYCLSI